MKFSVEALAHWLVDPHPRITDEEDIQRARLLSATLLVLAGLVSTILMLVIRADPRDIAEPTVQGAIGLLGVFLLMYFLNRAGYTKLAAAGVILPIIALFIYIPFYSGESPIFLAFLLIPVLLTALFYSPRWTAIISLTLLGVVFVLISIEDQTSDGSPFWNLRNLWYFLTVGTGLILTFITHTNRLETIRQDALKQLNAQVLENEARLRALVENSPDFILEINRQGDILFINHFPDQLIGENISDQLPQDQVDLAFHAVEKAFATGSPQFVDFRLHFPTDSITWYSARVGPVKQGNIVTSLTVILTDVTQQKEAQEQIQQLNETLEARVAERTSQLEVANKDLESFSYSVSHDLRAPLRGINGFARILEVSYASQLNETGQRAVQHIVENGNRMSQLIDDLLEFARLGQKALHKQDINPLVLIKETLNELQADINERHVNISLAENFPHCYADPTLLRQVFTNLLSNAIKYTRGRETAQIDVNWQEENGEVIYFVRDNGAGFDMKYADKLFGVFQRLHSEEEFEGTGVGLATVQRILHQHRGRIWAEAEVDKGATFYFTLAAS